MEVKSTTPATAISRRHFLLGVSVAAAALGFEPLAGMGASVHDNPLQADSSGNLCLWYDRPAKTWMTEALPIGNGPMGAMIFGGTEIERIQFNEITLMISARFSAASRSGRNRKPTRRSQRSVARLPGDDH